MAGMFDDLIPGKKAGKPAGMFDDIPKGGEGGEKPAEAPKMGKLEAAGRGAAAGATLNFADELAGLWSASGIPQLLGKLEPGTRDALMRGLLNNPLGASLAAGAPIVAGAARLGVEKLTGEEGEASRAYEETRDAVRAGEAKAKKDQPFAAGAGEVAGSLLLPGGSMLKAATLPGRMARGAVLGGATGAAAGAGEGEDAGDRLVRGLVGGGVGTGIGAVAPPLVEGVIQGGRLIAAPVVNNVRAALNPTGAAERAIAGAKAQAERADPNAINRLTEQDLVPGGPAVVMDVLGQPGRNLARSAKNISGEAGDIFDQTLDPRYVEQAPRLISWLRRTFAYPDAHAQQAAIEQTGKAASDMAYNVARKAGDHPIWSQELERLASAPEVVAAMGDAAVRGKSRAVLEGFGGFNPGVAVENGMVTFQRGANGVPTYPNLQFWDYTRRSLSNEASKAARAGDKEGVAIYGGLAKQMNAELDKLVPEYARARSTAASFFGAENALEAGQKFVSENFAIPQTRDVLAKMTVAERQLFQDGFVSRYIETLSNIPDRADVVRRIYNTPAAKEKIELVLGPARARELEAMLRVENIMQQGLSAVQGNSTTAMQIATAGLATGAAGFGTGTTLGFDPSTSGATALASSLVAAGKKGIDYRVASRIAQMLTSSDPAILQQATKIMSNNKQFMNALRAADNGIIRAGAEQGAGVMPSGTPQQ